MTSDPFRAADFNTGETNLEDDGQYCIRDDQWQEQEAVVPKLWRKELKKENKWMFFTPNT